MKEYLSFAIDLAKQAGKIITDNFDSNLEVDFKDNLSPVTKVDHEINALCIEKVKEAFPEHGIIAEEGSAHQDEEFVWICDPVDGTFPYSIGVPISVFMLALTRNGEPILSVIHDPFTNRMYVAQKDQGATMNGVPIQVSKSEDLSKSNFSAEISRNSPFNIKVIQKNFRRIITYVCIGQSGTLVARGKLEGCLFPNNNPWDIIPVALMIREAGGTVTDFDGNEINLLNGMNGMVATNGHIHDELMGIIHQSLISNN